MTRVWSLASAGVPAFVIIFVPSLAGEADLIHARTLLPLWVFGFNWRRHQRFCSRFPSV
jgi:hypothetical protein